MDVAGTDHFARSGTGARRARPLSRREKNAPALRRSPRASATAGAGNGESRRVRLKTRNADVPKGIVGVWQNDLRRSGLRRLPSDAFVGAARGAKRVRQPRITAARARADVLLLQRLVRLPLVIARVRAPFLGYCHRKPPLRCRFRPFDLDFFLRADCLVFLFQVALQFQ